MPRRLSISFRTVTICASATLALLIGGCADDDSDGHGAATPVATGTPTSTPSNTPEPSHTPTASPTTTPDVPNPTVEGPVTGPGNPFVESTSFDLSEVGYAQQEYFISGTARAYTNLGELGSDGIWNVTTADTAPFKTRFLVYRPIDPAKFNGSVIVEWLNVTGGIDAAPDWTLMHTELIRSGFVWVGVSAQLDGVEGSGGPGPIPGLPDLSLKGIAPQRYGSLTHPGDSFSYDIFSQVAQAIRHPVGVDPLGGLPPARVIATGDSQSAFRLVTYVNAIQPLVHLFDGFLIHSRSASGTALSQAPQPIIAAPAIVEIRADLDVPVLTFETETDLITLRFAPARQADGPLFRLWEVAGTAHADAYSLVVGPGDRGDSLAAADPPITTAPVPGIIVCAGPINAGPQHFVLKAAIAALDRWVRGGEAPPSAPRLELSGMLSTFVFDDLGNARGGIRTPYVDVPTATLSGLPHSGAGFCVLFGSTMPFDAATLASLYPDHDAYVSAVNDATDRAVAAGFILEPDAALIKEAAAASDVGG